MSERLASRLWDWNITPVSMPLQALGSERLASRLWDWNYGWLPAPAAWLPSERLASRLWDWNKGKHIIWGAPVYVRTLGIPTVGLEREHDAARINRFDVRTLGIPTVGLEPLMLAS